MEYGNRNPIWKWWFDLEYKDDKVVAAAKTNQRDLRPDRPIPKGQKITLFPPETIPPYDYKGAWSVKENKKRETVPNT